MPWPVKVYRVKPTFIERRFCNGAFCKLFCIINAISWICVTNGTSTKCWCCWSTKSIKGAELQRGEELKQNVFRNCVKTESHPQSNRSEVELLFLFTHIVTQCYGCWYEYLSSSWSLLSCTWFISPPRHWTAIKWTRISSELFPICSKSTSLSMLHLLWLLLLLVPKSLQLSVFKKPVNQSNL